MIIDEQTANSLAALATRRRRIPLIDRPGIVAVVSGDRTTYPQFSSSVATLQTTPGSALFWLTAGVQVAAARNELVRQAFAYAGTKPFWLWFIDDDQVFPADVLANMLRHDKDIIVPTVLSRIPPHHLFAWETFAVHESMTDEALLNALKTANPPPIKRLHARHFEPLEGGMFRPVEVGLAGTGGMLISSEVFKEMPDPWFEPGKFDADTTGEETWFCAKARRLGFRIYLDLDTAIGHLTTCAVWPEWQGASQPGWQGCQIAPRINLSFNELQVKSYQQTKL